MFTSFLLKKIPGFSYLFRWNTMFTYYITEIILNLELSNLQYISSLIQMMILYFFQLISFFFIYLFLSIIDCLEVFSST